MENIMEDMMDKSFEELPTETFLELKRKRIRENRIHELDKLGVYNKFYH